MTIRQFSLALAAAAFVSTCAWGQQYVINTYAGNHTAGSGGDSGPPTSASLNLPLGLAFDSSGNIYIADSANNSVRKISGGNITTVAGNGTAGYSGDGAAATSAELRGPSGVAVDSAGNIFIADTANHVIREVTTNGNITTFAGNNTGGYAGDGGAANVAELAFPTGVAVDSHGNVFIADSANQAIREVSGGNISTVIGGLNDPESVLVDAAGNLYITEQSGFKVSKYSNGVLTVLAGSGDIGYSGDNGPAVDAVLNEPTGIALDSNGYLYICDTTNSVIRKVSPSGVITTIAGTTVGGRVTPGYGGDGGPATSALLNFPHGILVDGSGNVYVADTDNQVIRLMKPVTPAAAANGVVNAASFKSAVSPGALATIFGSNFTGAGIQAVAASLPLQKSLGGVSVEVNGVAAPVLYASATQINFQIPWETKPGPATVSVAVNGLVSNKVNITVQAAAPGLFFSGSHAIAQNANFTLNSSSNPAKAGDFITAYLTGAGAVTHQPADGAAAGSNSVLTSTPTATIGGQPVTKIQFAGLAPTFVGLWQFNLQVPTGVTKGDLPLVITVNGQASNASNVSVTP
ncbi:MAG TPA: IPT/TIG domain-containing protein [Bryobacteraceae bacterium]|nr:IPT/TIG domain-containing protein [Bryobacteraceae bacterium]